METSKNSLRPTRSDLKAIRMKSNQFSQPQCMANNGAV